MTDEPKKPKLAVVAENSQKQIDTGYAQERVNYALLQLAANIIRVVRGAGKPEELIKQCAEVVNRAVDFDEVARSFPSPFSLAEAIRLEHHPLQYEDEFWCSRQIGERQMINGALQYTASRLLGQATQERRGESEIYEGYRTMENAYEEVRKKRAAEERAARAKVAPKKKAAKKKRRKKSVTAKSKAPVTPDVTL